MKRSKSLYDERKRDEQKQSLLKNVDEAAPLQLNYERPYQKYLLQVAHLQVQQNGAVLNQPLSFNLMQDQCLVLFGQNGVGKTRLLKQFLAIIN